MCRAEVQIRQDVLQNSFPCLYFLVQDEIMNPEFCQRKADGFPAFFFKKVQNFLKKYSVGWGWANHISSSSLDHPCCLPEGVGTILLWFGLHSTCRPARGALGPKSESQVSFQLANYWADLPDHSHQRHLPSPFILAKWKDCRGRKKGRHRVSTIADFQIPAWLPSHLVVCLFINSSV